MVLSGNHNINMWKKKLVPCTGTFLWWLAISHLVIRLLRSVFRTAFFFWCPFLRTILFILFWIIATYDRRDYRAKTGRQGTLGLSKSVCTNCDTDASQATFNYLQSVQHTSTRKGPCSCSPHRPSLPAPQAPPSRIQDAVKDKTLTKFHEMFFFFFLINFDDWSYFRMKPILTDDTLDHLVVDLLGKWPC